MAIFWVAIEQLPLRKKKTDDDGDEKPQLPELLLEPVAVVAKDEQAAGLKVTLDKSEMLRDKDPDRLRISVSPF